MALTDLTRISTSGIATGTSLSGAILHGDAHFRGTQVGVTSALFDSSDNALEFNDNVKIKLGNSGDLTLYHDGNNSVIENATSDLNLISTGDDITLSSADDILLRVDTNKAAVNAKGLGEVILYYNAAPKFETTSHGAVVTGILTATSFSGPTNNTSGIATFYDLRVSNNLTVEGTTTTLDTNLIGVDRVEVGANSNSIVGVAITQSGTADIVNLFDGATKVVTVDDVGNVGLGSAIPRSKLDVSGNIYGNKLYGDAAVYVNGHPQPSLYLTSTTTTGRTSIYFGDSASALAGRIMYQNNGDYFQIFTSFGERVRIDGNGYVGIGITNPDSPLEVVHDGPSIATLHHSDGGTNDEARIMLGALANNPPDNRGAGIAAINMGSGHDLSVKTSSTHSASPTEKLRVKNDGQILHGTTAHGGPYDGLTPAFISEQVNDYHAFTLAVNSTNAGHSGILQFVRSRGNADGANTIVNNGDRVASIYGIVADGTDRNSSVAAIDYRVDGVVGVNSTPGRIEFRLTPSSGNVPVERVRINALGYMGVGAAAASNPQTSLHIQDSSGATGAAQLKVSKGSGATGAPDAISRANNYIHLGGSEWRGTGDGYYMIGFGYTNDNVGTGMPAYVGFRETSNSGYTQGDLIFGTRGNTTGTNNPIERLRITSDGKIGIGHHIATQINSELTIRPANDGGILLGRPGDTVAPINKALTITTTTTGSEAYHTKYHTYNCNSIFATYEGGGTGGNFIFKTGVGNGNETEKLRITSGGVVNIGGNYTQTTYKAQITTGTNKHISFTNAAHDDLSNEGSGIIFSRQNDGSKELSGIFGHSNSSLGIAARTNITLHAGGTSNYGSAPERLRIGSGGEVSLRRGGISATPSLEIYGSGNTSNSVDSLRFHNWGDSDGDYWRISANAGLNSSGNDAKIDNSKNGAGITIDGRYGRVFLKTSSTNSTVNDALIVDKNGVVSTPLQPAFRTYTTADKTNNGDFGGDSASPNNSSWADPNGNFFKWDNNDDFDHTTGRFTAPVDGKYHFTCVWDAKNVRSMIDMKINGTYAIRYEPTGFADQDWETHSWSCTVVMGAGDYAILNGRGASGSYPFHMGSGYWGFWTGHKIA